MGETNLYLGGGGGGTAGALLTTLSSRHGRPGGCTRRYCFRSTPPGGEINDHILILLICYY